MRAVSAIDKLRAFAESREADVIPLPDGALSYGDVRELLGVIVGGRGTAPHTECRNPRECACGCSVCMLAHQAAGEPWPHDNTGCLRSRVPHAKAQLIPYEPDKP